MHSRNDGEAGNSRGSGDAHSSMCGLANLCDDCFEVADTENSRLLDDGSGRAAARRDYEQEGGEDGVFENELEPIEEDIYGLAAASLIRDVTEIWKRSSQIEVRTARLLSSLSLIGITISVQLFLLMGAKRLLCVPMVLEIRSVYSDYETTMYPNFTVRDQYGFARGIPGYFDPTAFDKLSEETRDVICHIPLAHPHFLACLLLCWSASCMFHLRRLCENISKFVNTPTCARLMDGVKMYPDTYDNHDLSLEIYGLPFWMKTLLMVTIYVPRCFTVLALLWLGSRWLLATASPEDLMLNALALEFILLLPELFYNVMASNRSKKSVSHTMTRPYRKRERVTWCTMFDAYGWGIIAVVWVFTYVYYLQAVLPDYNWDVRDVCNEHEKEIIF